jgi:Arc/MetJ-type ribon-helix-helix transcriptional regulator
MSRQFVIPKKKRGPPPTGKGEPIMVRMHKPQLSRLDDWIADQGDHPSRPEAIRRLLEHALSVGKRRK